MGATKQKNKQTNDLITGDVFFPVSTDTGWKPCRGYCCKKCNTMALRHPKNKKIWGCPQCNIATHNVFVYFKTLAEDNSCQGYKEERQSLKKKFKLGPGRKKERLDKKTQLMLQDEAERYEHILRMGEIYKETETRRFG